MKNSVKFLIILVFIFYGFSEVFAQQDIPKGVPKLYIQLFNNYKLGDITRNTKFEGTMRIENANGSNFPDENLYNGNIRIAGRGNSSWTDSKWQDDYKRSYSIDLTDRVGKKTGVPLLGMPKSADWILFASHFDRSFLRNYFSYELSLAMGHWAARSWFVELFVNGEYRGLYSVMENIRNEEEREYVNDGFIIESDYPQRLRKDNLQYITSSRIYDGRWYYDDGPVTDSMYFGFKYPKDDIRTPAQTKYAKDYITDFETALYGSDYLDPNIGYQRYIDAQSFADWYIIAELGADWDHSYYLSSCYLTKPEGEKMKMCPVWDFDLAYNSVDYIVTRNNVPWIRRMWNDDSFRQLVFRRFEETLPLLENLLKHIEEVGADLNRYGALDRNFEKWDVLGVILRGREIASKTYEGELRKLIQRIRERYMYIATNSNNGYCNILKNMKPGIRFIDQDDYDDCILPIEVIASALRTGVLYLWNDEPPELYNRYTITDYGKYSLTIKIGTCESPPSDTIYIKRMGTVTVSDEKQQYDGNPKNVTVTTDPSELPVRITYNGSDTPPVEIGEYRVVAEIEDDLYKGKQVSTLKIVKDINTGTPEMPDASLIVYPNPTNGILNIEGLEYLITNRPLTIELINMAGVTCIRKQTADPKFTLDISGFPNGLYLLRISDEKQNIVEKVVKME